MPVLDYAHGGPPLRGVLRASPEDFRVCELPLVEPDGQGEHAWLWIRKRNENTDHVAGLLSRHAGVHPREVSYAGMKDRNAVTEQWFSVHLPGRADPDWSALDSDSVTVLRHARHSRKLQRGTLRGNSFSIILRALLGGREQADTLLARIRDQGVPNYFGPQRFGAGNGNLHTAAQLFRNPRLKLSRNRRSLALSAARSLLFNRVLTQRVTAANWNHAIPGDALQLDGSHSFFIAETIDTETEHRIAIMDVHPTGPLCGAGPVPVLGEALALETTALSASGEMLRGLVAAGLRHERRALRLPVRDLAWRWIEGDELALEFSLPAGCFATSVLRELLQEDAPPAGC